jgi:hypothetical protein
MLIDFFLKLKSQKLPLSGALMSYGQNFQENIRRAATFVGQDT